MFEEGQKEVDEGKIIIATIEQMNLLIPSIFFYASIAVNRISGCQDVEWGISSIYCEEFQESE